MVQINTYFKNPRKQYNDLLKELRLSLNQEVVEEIIEFVNDAALTKEVEMMQILMKERFENLTQVYKRFRETKNKQEYYKLLQRFFKLVDPSDIALDIESALTFNEIKYNYETFIREITRHSNEYGNYFSRYKWNESVFSFLIHGLKIQSNDLIDALDYHAYTMRETSKSIKRFNESRGERVALKVGASILGSLIAGPLGGFAAKGIASSFLDDDYELKQAIYKVEESFDSYCDALDKYFKQFEWHYKHILLTLYGGSIMRVNEDLQAINYQFKSFSIYDYTYILEVNHEVYKQIEKWVTDGLQQVDTLLKNEKLEESLFICRKLYEYIQTNQSLMSRIKINEKELVDLIQTYYLGILFLKGLRLYKEDSEEFLLYVEEIFLHLPYMIHDEELIAINFPTYFDLIVKTVVTSHEHISFTALLSFLNYIERITPENKSNLDLSTELEHLIAQLIFYMYSIRTIDSVNIDFYINFESDKDVIKEIRKKYSEIGQLDKFYLSLPAPFFTRLYEKLKALVV